MPVRVRKAFIGDRVGPKSRKRHRARLGREREIAEILVEFEPVIGRLGLGQRREAGRPAPSRSGPIRPRMPPSATPWPPRNLVVEWHDQSRRPSRTAGTDTGVASVLSTISGMPASCATAATFSISTTMPPGLARFSTKIALHARGQRAAEILRVGRIDEMAGPAELLERQAELGQRAAIEIARGDELVARRHQREEDQELRRVARGGGDRGAPAFEAGDALFEHRDGRVGQPRIDVAEIVQVEERGGVIDIVEHIGGRLIDRRRARAGGRVGRGAGMHGQRLEPVAVVVRRLRGGRGVAGAARLRRLAAGGSG